MSKAYFRDNSSRSNFRSRFAVGDIPQYKVGEPICNYFGNGQDGNLTVSSNLNLPSIEDGDMIVKQYKSLTINSGRTLTTSNRCRGLMIYVQKNCIVNGTLSMTARGCKANPSHGEMHWETPVAPSDGNGVDASGLRIPMITATGTQSLSAANFNGCGNAAVNVVVNHLPINGDGTIFGVSKLGGGYNGATLFGNIGCAGSGGRGQSRSYGGGRGSNSTCFSGGCGGGGPSRYSGGGIAGNYGGVGGRIGNRNTYGSGGAGNPYGLFDSHFSGTGGTLILIIGGNLTINGSIESLGNSSVSNYARGGGSGGGRILILYKGVYNNNGDISSSGGDIYGGAGAITTAQVM